MLAGFPIPVASGVGNPVLHEDAGDAYICQPLAYVGTFESDCAVLANRQCLEAAAREYEHGDPLRTDVRAVQKERRPGQGILLVGKLPYSILRHARIFRAQWYFQACQPRGPCAGCCESRLCVGKGGRSLLAVGGEKSLVNER